jgi:hypothetical protein
MHRLALARGLRVRERFRARVRMAHAQSAMHYEAVLIVECATHSVNERRSSSIDRKTCDCGSGFRNSTVQTTGLYLLSVPKPASRARMTAWARSTTCSLL